MRQCADEYLSEMVFLSVVAIAAEALRQVIVSFPPVRPFVYAHHLSEATVARSIRMFLLITWFLGIDSMDKLHYQSLLVL